MKITRQILIILATIQLSLIWACNTIKDTQIIGEYKFSGSTLVLNSDKTFELDWQAGLISSKIYGKYEVDGKHLLLRASEKLDNKNFEIHIPPQTKRSDFELMIIDQNWNRLIGATCELQKNNELIRGAVTNEEGFCVLPYSEDGKIIISYLGYVTAEINLDSISVYSIIVELNNENYYEHFINRKMLIKDNKLIDKNIKPKWEFVKKETK